jgi:hypothetical protein
MVFYNFSFMADFILLFVRLSYGRSSAAKRAIAMVKHGGVIIKIFLYAALRSLVLFCVHRRRRHV